jgi:type I restriction enzyme S subunit
MTPITQSATNWVSSKLEDVCREIIVGYVGPMALEYVEDGIPFLRSQNVHPFRLDLSNIKFITPEFNKKIKKSILHPGDVVVVRTGNAGIACVIPPDLPYANCADLVIFRLGDNLDPYYLACLFNSTWGQGQVAGKLVGLAQQHFNIGVARELTILLPPLSVQQKIANILSSWDRAIDLTEQLIAAKQQRKLGLMQQLLTGKRRFPEFSNHWQTVEIGDLLSESRINGSDGRTARKITVKLYGKGVVPKEEKMSGSAATKYYKRRAGQFIYSKLDFLNGAFGIIPPEMDGYESTLDLPCFDFKGGVLPQFFLYFVSRESFYSRFASAALGGRKARRIQVEEFLESEIEIPEIEEQEKIVKVLVSCDQEMALLNRKLSLLKKQKQGLMQQLLTGRIRVKI